MSLGTHSDAKRGPKINRLREAWANCVALCHRLRKLDGAIPRRSCCRHLCCVNGFYYFTQSEGSKVLSDKLWLIESLIQPFTRGRVACVALALEVLNHHLLPECFSYLPPTASLFFDRGLALLFGIPRFYKLLGFPSKIPEDSPLSAETPLSNDIYAPLRWSHGLAETEQPLWIAHVLYMIVVTVISAN